MGANLRRVCGISVLDQIIAAHRRSAADDRRDLDALVALRDEELATFRALAADLAMAALVEVHDEVELARALAAGADIVGVNQRDLTTFDVDRTLAARLAPRIPETVVTVAESGIRA